MARGKLTPEEQEILKANPNVISVSDFQVKYSKEFKDHFIEEYKKGKRPVEIFSDAGFDINILGTKRIERAAQRWKEAAGIGIPNYRREVTKEAEDHRRQKLLEQIEAEKEKSKLKLQKKDQKIAELEAEVELLKKAGNLGRRRCAKKEFGKTDLCKLMEETLAEHKEATIKGMCEALGIARGTYYYYLQHKEDRLDKESQDLNSFYFVKKAFDSNDFYKKGSRSIRQILKNDFEVNFNRKRIQRLMKKYNLVCPIRTRNPYKGIWKATEEDRVAPNIVKRNFKTGEARKVLLTDITYIKHQDRFSYLSVVIDAQTTEPIAYKLSDNMKMDFVLDTISQINPQDLADDVVIHSDQGVHYTSKAFRTKVSELGIKQSMSRRGNCLDNSAMESFFGHMKQEAHFDKNSSEEELSAAVDKYINYYRYHRYQEKLDGKTPFEYYNTLRVA